MRAIVLAIGACVALACCGPAATTTSTPTPASSEAASPAGSAANAPETTVIGQVVDVEDGGYPQFAVTFRADGASDDLLLYLNAEAADLGGQPPQSFKGKTISLRYVTTPDNALTGLWRDGHSLIGEAPIDPTDATATGVLSGADAPTVGDLPGTISVTEAGGKRTDFEYFVTREIAAANGRQVTAYFETRPLHSIRSMTTAP